MFWTRKQRLTAIYKAIRNENLTLAYRLIPRDFQIDEPIYDEMTLLGAAVLFGQEPLVQYALSHGANPDVSADDERSALHTAVISGNRDIVRMLLAHNARIDTTDDEGKTPLDYASRNEEILRMITEHNTNRSNQP